MLGCKNLHLLIKYLTTDVITQNSISLSNFIDDKTKKKKNLYDAILKVQLNHVIVLLFCEISIIMQDYFTQLARVIEFYLLAAYSQGQLVIIRYRNCYFLYPFCFANKLRNNSFDSFIKITSGKLNFSLSKKENFEELSTFFELPSQMVLYYPSPLPFFKQTFFYNYMESNVLEIILFWWALTNLKWFCTF